MAHRVTLIPGDGTGPELAEATRRVLEATGVEFEWDVQDAGSDVMDQNGGNPLPGARARVDPAEWHRAEGADHDSGRRRLPLRERRPPRGARSLCPGSPLQELCGRSLALRGRRPDHRPREHGGPLRRRRVRRGNRGRRRADRLARGQGLRQDPPRLRHLDQADLRDRHATDRPVRLRLCAPQRPPQGHGRPQGQHHEVHRRALPPRRPGRRGREHRHRVRGPDRRQPLDATRAAAGGIRRARAARISTATSSPTSPRA